MQGCDGSGPDLARLVHFIDKPFSQASICTLNPYIYIWVIIIHNHPQLMRLSWHANRSDWLESTHALFAYGRVPEAVDVWLVR